VRRLLVPAAILLALPAHAAAAPPTVAVQASPALGAAPLTTTLTASGDAVSYRWELPGNASAAGPSVTTVFPAGRWVVGAVGTSATGEETRMTVTVTSVSLSLSGPSVAAYGARVYLTGRTVPALPGSRLAVQRDGRAAGSGVVRAGGRFRIGLRPRVPHNYVVAFGGAVSNAVSIAVRPRVTVSLAGPPVVGGRLVATAAVQPAAAGRLALRVYRRGRLVAQRRGRASVRLPLSTTRPGVYRVVAKLEPAHGFTPRTSLLDAVIRVPELGIGSAGGSVLELARRLTALGYALQGVNATYGWDDYEAVLAFQKLHGLPRTGRVDTRFWQLLAQARRPTAHYGGDHIEVDKTRQVLLLVRDGRVVLVSHVSTGATGNTPIGRFRVYRKVVGWDWVLWYPMYFLRGFAIHGYPEVPAYPASHGCVRIPMWLAPRLFSENGYGTTIYVY
jgi:L,D-transpeptidase-like protein/putative peptidoglycan binding protein